MARYKSLEKLHDRNALDFADLHSEHLRRATVGDQPEATDTAPERALLRLRALTEAPVDPTRPNWVPLGPLAVPGGQSYGGARVLISGRVTAIAPHPTNANRIFIGTSRGGVWRTD